MVSLATHVTDAVNAALEQRGESVQGLALATGIPRTTLIRRLGGFSPFTVAELDAIAAALCLDVSALLPEPEQATA